MTCNLEFMIILSIIFISFIILEIILSRQLIASFFNLGLPIYKKHISKYPLPNNVTMNHTYNLNYGKYIFTSMYSCIFISKFQLFKIFPINTLLPFKCIMHWTSTDAFLHIRLPLGSSIFFIMLIFSFLSNFYRTLLIQYLIYLVVTIIIILLQLAYEYYVFNDLLNELDTITAKTK